MDMDEGKIDDTVLALLWLTLHSERCAWKGFDWATTDRLHRKGLIGSYLRGNRYSRCLYRLPLPYVDGSHLQVYFTDIFDRIACFHMCGLRVWSHMTTGQDGFRNACS
jgi:hypothetical protein